MARPMACSARQEVAGRTRVCTNGASAGASVANWAAGGIADHRIQHATRDGRVGSGLLPIPGLGQERPLKLPEKRRANDQS